ncbi:MAG: uroporphyrinogen decarboxylase, partial [Gemmatimonadetes bacterium]|nr:uroporphyrinogen decarboxylase [Gemmatimonadota bacterium]
AGDAQPAPRDAAAARSRAGSDAPDAAPASGRAHRFLAACRREPVDATPVWFMRQAGRYMEEYRAIRAKHTLLEICAQPELAAEVTLQPVRAFDVDAAILFADILLPLVPMGFELEFAAGEGPVIHNPVRSRADVDRLRPVEPREALAPVLEAVRLVRRELDGQVPLIGFAGAPFTLASYLIQGGSAREAAEAKKLMYAEPATWHALMNRLATVVADYLVAQIEAGAQAVQLFDSWVGALAPDDYREYVLPYSRRILRAAEATGVPVIHFGTGTATLLPAMKEAGGTVLGIDWRTPLRLGREVVRGAMAIQGNLDPVALFAPPAELERRIRRVLDDAGPAPGHIFNLGHGILQHTPVDAVRRAAELVHELSRR